MFRNIPIGLALIFLFLSGCHPVNLNMRPGKAAGESDDSGLSSISALSVSTSTRSYFADQTPNLLIVGSLVQGETVRIYSDNNCSSLIGSEVISLQQSIQSWMSVTPSQDLDGGDYEFSASVGNSSS